MHSLANIGGVVAFLTNAQAGFADLPWIFSKDVRRHSLIGRIFGIVWLLSVAGLIASGVGVIFQQEWWRWLAILSCALSLVAIVPWWKTVPPGARFGAFFDLLVIILLSFFYRKIRLLE
jgi:hypothetical protein